MQKAALVVIDLQNDITKNCRTIIDAVNQAVDWAVKNAIHVVYIRHENTSPGSRTFLHGTRGVEFVPELNIVSDNIFTKYRGNALTNEAFAAFVQQNEIDTFYIAGADAVACVKSTCYNMRKADYAVTVLQDCVTSYDLRKMDAMLRYYESRGCALVNSEDLKSHKA